MPTGLLTQLYLTGVMALFSLSSSSGAGDWLRDRDHGTDMHGGGRRHSRAAFLAVPNLGGGAGGSNSRRSSAVSPAAGSSRRTSRTSQSSSISNSDHHHGPTGFRSRRSSVLPSSSEAGTSSGVSHHGRPSIVLPVIRGGGDDDDEQEEEDSTTPFRSTMNIRMNVQQEAVYKAMTSIIVPVITHEPCTPQMSVKRTAPEPMLMTAKAFEASSRAVQDQDQYLMPIPNLYQQVADKRRRDEQTDHTGSRWQENLPLTGDGAVDGDGDAHTIITQTDAEDPDEPTTIKGKIKKFVKILVPHVILISMLLGYLSFGAIVLTHMESSLETHKRRVQMSQLMDHYERIANRTWEIQQRDDINQSFWSAQLKEFFLDLATTHEGNRFRHQFNLYPDIDSKWTFPTALLYALTVLTTCGYGEVGVYTTGGQLFAVAFALVGIPLMFITAADIGKFLSESLMKALDLTKTCWSRLKSLCTFRKKPEETCEEMENDDDEFYEHPPEALEKLWFPIITYLSVISGYCAIGAVMFRTWEPDWKFIHAFHFGFNLIVTVGLGEIVVTDPVFLCLIVAFVIVGLSVVTMCVDLASTHLKAYFTQLHYFGRAKKFLDMGDDIRNMMEYLAWMRKKKGGQVTWQDVRDLMESIRLGPYNPREAAKWRWIDESSSALSTFRLSAYGAPMGPDGMMTAPPGHRPGSIDRHSSYLDYKTSLRMHRSRCSRDTSLTPRRSRGSRTSKGSRELSPFTEDSLHGDYVPNGRSSNGGGPPRDREYLHDDKSFIDEDEVQ